MKKVKRNNFKKDKQVSIITIVSCFIIGTIIVFFDIIMWFSSFSDKLSKEEVPLISILVCLVFGLFGVVFLFFSIINWVKIIIKKEKA